MSSEVVLIVGAVEHRELAVHTALERAYRLVVVDEPGSALLPWAHVAVPVADILDEKCVRAGIEQALRVARPDAVLTFYDELFPLVAEVAADLELPFVGHRTALLNADQSEQRTALAAAGVPIPSWTTCDDLRSVRVAAERLGYPAILKVADQAGAGKIRVAGPDELVAAYEEVAGLRLREEVPLLIEELMLGQEYSVEAFVQHGRITPVCLTRKLTTGGAYPVELGHALPYQGPDGDAVLELALAAIRAVDADHTLVHTEVFMTAAGPKVVEVNTRSGGDRIMDLVAHSCGVNPYEVMYDLALGQEPRWRPEWRSAAAIRFVAADRTGRFAGLADVQHALTLPGLLHLGIDQPYGAAVRTPRGGQDRIGWVVAEGESWRQAQERADRIAAGLAPRIDTPDTTAAETGSGART
ncbi:ATP-grasp domain-containing protein [Nonomuraea sp. H19]|uniref:ATP-grasp domain-containing protein n=1 Tax=Nonomuraea sp. H19 TaxID=3452206 RepID=UPI003F89638B